MYTQFLSVKISLLNKYKFPPLPQSRYFRQTVVHSLSQHQPELWDFLRLSAQKPNQVMYL